MGNFTQVDTIIFMRNDHEKENIDNDNEFDYNAQDIDAFCTSHDIDDYDLFGEIMVGDDASYDELSDNILYE